MRSHLWLDNRRWGFMVITGLAAIMVAAHCRSAHALGDCPQISPSTEKKFVVSQLITSAPQNFDKTKASSYAVLAVSHFAVTLSNDLKASFVVVSCEQRLPHFDTTDFQPDVVDELTNRNVLLEVWGNLSTSQRRGGRPRTA